MSKLRAVLDLKLKETAYKNLPTAFSGFINFAAE